MALVDILTEAGYAVCAAGDGMQALEQVAQRRFAVILTDHQMPRMNGLTLLGVIRKRFPLTPVIMISGAGPGPEQIALERGVFAFIRKPFSPEAVLDMVWHATRSPAARAEQAGPSASPRKVTKHPVPFFSSDR